MWDLARHLYTRPYGCLDAAEEDTMARSRTGSWTFALLLSAASAGCAAGDDLPVPPAASNVDTGAGGGAESSCTPGKQESCACPGGDDGVQVCSSDGSGFEACECDGGGSTSGAGGSAPSDPCGDGVCLGEENCHTCEADCGTCAPCDIAPGCIDAMIPGNIETPADDLNVALEYVPQSAILARLQQRVSDAGPAMRVVAAALSPERAGETRLVAYMRAELAKNPTAEAAIRRSLAKVGLDAPDAYRQTFPEILPALETMDGEFPEGGTLECGAPMLRVRVASIKVHEEDDDVANDIVYCAIVTEGADGGEIRVTPQTPNLDEGDSHSFSIESGVMWGQVEPRTPGGNLMITYDCFEADTNDGYANLIGSIGQASSKVGGILDDDQGGWIFSIAGAVAPIITDALVLDGDDHLFNATQIIPVEKHLEMTNGRFWSVRREGTHLWSDWDWELRVEAWGCAEYGDL
jgi:hypothetical protein